MSALCALAACGGDPPARTLAAEARPGQALAERLGCASCHDPDDAAAIGPSWIGAWETQVQLDDGSTVTFDTDYVTRSVRDPKAQRRAGDWVQMPQYDRDQLSDDDLAAIVTYLRALGDRS